MNCEEYQQQVSKLLDNALESGKTADVFGHLGVCDRCREFFESTMQIRLVMRSAGPLPMSAAMDGQVLQTGNAEAHRMDNRGSVQSLQPFGFLRSRIATTPTYLLKKRVSLSFTALLLCLTLLGTLSISYLWSPKPHEIIEPVVYMKLPTVEVNGGVEQEQPIVR